MSITPSSSPSPGSIIVNNNNNNTEDYYKSSTSNSNTQDILLRVPIRIDTPEPGPGPGSGSGHDKDHDNDNTSTTILHPTIVGDKYILLDHVEGTNLRKCIHINTQHKFVCKVVGKDCSGLLAAHYRLDCQPHVNPLHEVLLGDKKVYLIFPRSYSDLHYYVKSRKRLREPEAKRLFRQMAETVRSCHDQGIVLRDLKLRKFVFSDEQCTELKLESLEDAVVLDHTDDDLLLDKRGCPAYVSPEILRAHRTYSGKAADMWSLGVILYTMLVGRYPFNDSEHASLFAKISRGYFVVPECLSSRAKCLIRSLLRKEPSERLGASEVLLHPWLAEGDRLEPWIKSTDQCVPDVQIPDEDYL